MKIPKLIKQHLLSIIAVLAIVGLLVHQSYKSGSWRNNRSIIHDITSYYSYLPAVFIYDDLDFEYRYQLPPNEPVDHLWVNERGDTVFQKMSIGLSYFYLPSFLIADFYVKTTETYNRNGFSKPYQMAMNANTLFFGFLGVILIFLLLRSYFSDVVTAISLILLYAGTNLLYYVAVAPGLSHPYSLLLLTLLFLLMRAYVKKPRLFILALLGLVAGWLVLVRPTNLILCLIPAIFFLQGRNYKVLRDQFLSKPVSILVFLFALAIPWLPQFMYWKHAVGSYIFYSYDEEGFFFLKPHVIDGLISYRKGWFVYTPLMIIAMLGLLFSSKLRNLRASILIVMIPFVYVVFSWWCWWYGGSFGSRVMVETYPFMAIGLALVIEKSLKRSWLLQIPIFSVLVFCVYLNLQQIGQFTVGMLHWDSMSKDAYWSIFLKDNPPPNFQELIIQPDYKKAMKEGE